MALFKTLLSVISLDLPIRDGFIKITGKYNLEDKHTLIQGFLNVFYFDPLIDFDVKPERIDGIANGELTCLGIHSTMVDRSMNDNSSIILLRHLLRQNPFSS